MILQSREVYTQGKMDGWIKRAPNGRKGWLAHIFFIPGALNQPQLAAASRKPVGVIF